MKKEVDTKTLTEEVPILSISIRVAQLLNQVKVVNELGEAEKKYTIDSGPMLTLKGQITIKRNDGKPIELEWSDDYPARIY